MLVSRMRCTIITGARNAGKTRTATQLAASLRGDGERVGGIISEARIEDGVKAAYSFVDLSTGIRAEYAVRKAGPVPPGARAYDFLDSGMAFGCSVIRAAASSGVDALFVDEVGPLEIDGLGLWAAIFESLHVFRGRVILTVRPSLVEELRARVEPFAESVQIIRAEPCS
jgi:nucleoside-triphosphatase THEP1